MTTQQSPLNHSSTDDLVTIKNVCDRCPLTSDGAFGLIRGATLFNICSKTKQRKLGLYQHFISHHDLKPIYARRLVQAIINEKDSTTQLFDDDENIIDHFYKITCPFNDGTINLFNNNKNKIDTVSCPSISIPYHSVKSHLKTRHHISDQVAQSVYENIKQIRELNGLH